MRALRPLTFLAIFAATSAGVGCAAISGLDKLEKVDDEAGASDAAQDITVGDAHVDVTPSDDASDDAMPDGDDSSVDSGVDSTMGDGMADGMADAPNDARDAATDAPAPIDARPDVDSGCGSLMSITNCAACGNVCNTTTSMGSPACNGTSCLYGACNAGRADCNSSAAPDLDGCECATPSCCGNACATVHDNGVGNAFYDCVARDTFNQNQALEACAAFTNTPCQLYTCSTAADGGGTFLGNMVCADTAVGACACWGYDTTFPGRVIKLNGTGNCSCPNGASARWH